MTMRENIEASALQISTQMMDILRGLDWQVRELVCQNLSYNDEFCWHCGMERPRSGKCHCKNDK